MDVYDDDKYFPYSTALELTLSCNMLCLHCGSNATTRNRENNLSYEEWRRVIDDLIELNGVYITFSGGEPFMYPKWRELLKYVYEKRKNIKEAYTCIISNGTLVTQSDVIFMKEHNLHTLAISIDGDEKIHDHIRQMPGAFKKIIKTIELCKKHGQAVSAVVSINKMNFPIRKKIVDIVRDLGIKACQIQIVNSFGRAGEFKDKMLITHEEYRQLIDDVYEMQKKYGPDFRLLSADSLGYCWGNAEKILEKDSEWSGCPAGTYSLGIEANGNVKGCLSLQDDTFITGNIRERSLVDIWNDENSFPYTRKYDPDKMKGKCGLCISKDQCRAGCFGIAYSVTGSIYENPYCYKTITGH